MTDDPRVTRARSHVASALMVAERRLREALGVLERRRRFAGAARAAATLGCLLRERGDRSRAESTLERARVLFDVAVSTTEWPTTATRPASPAGGLTLHSSEREDHVLARALLSADADADERPSGSLGSGERIARVADVTIELLRTQMVGDGLESLCGRLRTIIDATAVVVFSPTAATRPLVTVGSLPRTIAKRARDAPLAGRGVSMGETDGSAQIVVPIRVDDQDHPLARLVAYWSRPPVATRLASIDCLLRVASVLCAPMVHLILDREMVQSVEHPSGLVGNSRQIRELRATVTEQAACPFPILIEGEIATQ